MKKVFAILLAMMLVLSMGTAAMAEDTGAQTTVTVTKVYKLEGAGSNPEETFTLEQVGNGVVKTGEATSAPALTKIDGAKFVAGAATTNGAEANITITLPTYTNVGVYEYTLKEVVGTTAGVTYYGDEIKLVVTVANATTGDSPFAITATVHTEKAGADTKSNRITNTYSANSLTVTKKVDGNLGDKTKKFNFQVTFTGNNVVSNVTATIAGTKDETFTFTTGVAYTFALADGESAVFENLPAGVTYEVEETDTAVKVAEGETKAEYSVSYDTSKTGTIAANQTSQTTVTNTKSADIDTGITTDSLPYILLMAFVVLSGAVLLLKRRNAYND